MIAIATPIMMPAAIAMTVSSNVKTSPWRTSLDVKYCPTTFQPKRHVSCGAQWRALAEPVQI